MNNNLGCVKTFATLCIDHQKFNKIDIEQILGVDSERTSIFGTKMNINSYMYSSEHKLSSNDLMNHIQFLIDGFLINIRKLKKLNSSYQVRIFAYWESLNGNGGPLLKEEQMLVLGAEGIDLILEFY